MSAIILRLFAIILFSATCFQGSARAEGRCPPGYYPTGGGDAGWLACAPMGPVEEQEAPDSGPDPGPPPPPDRFMVLVAHRDTSALWITSGYKSREAAEKAATRACMKQMAKGCYPTWWGFNSFTVAVVRDLAGLTFVQGDINPDAAKAKAMAVCEEQSLDCSFVNFITNSDRPQDRFPATKPPIHKFAVIAWPKASAPSNWKRKYWLASGVSGFEAAVETAVKRCEADTGVECVRGQHSSAGVIARFVDGVGKTYWIDAANAEAAAKRVAANCPQGEQCRMVEIYAADRSWLSVIDEDRADEPIRGFFAIATPGSFSKYGKLALVTGQPSREAARAAAISLCQLQSNSKCVPFLEEDDWGTEQFVEILRDSSGRTRIEFGFSRKQVAENMDAFCKAENVTCPEGQIFDLSEATNSMVGVTRAM